MPLSFTMTMTRSPASSMSSPKGTLTLPFLTITATSASGSTSRSLSFCPMMGSPAPTMNSSASALPSISRYRRCTWLGPEAQAGAHGAQDGVAGDLLGVHHAVQAHHAQDGVVVLVVVFHHHLVHPVLMGIETRHDVVLVPAGQGDEGVVAEHSLLHQHLMVGAVPQDDIGLRQQLRDLPGLFRVNLDDGHADARFNQKPSQIKGDAAAPMIITLVIFTIFLPRARKRR